VATTDQWPRASRFWIRSWLTLGEAGEAGYPSAGRVIGREADRGCPQRGPWGRAPGFAAASTAGQAVPLDPIREEALGEAPERYPTVGRGNSTS
jgi:hypothetical protein